MGKIIRHLLVFFILVSCSGEATTREKKNEIVSTKSASHIESKSEFERFILGGWKQLNSNCNNEGLRCDSLIEQISWYFNGEDVKINNYTHPYTIIEDTIYIGVLPYRIASNPGDTVLLHSVSVNEYLWLKKN